MPTDPPEHHEDCPDHLRTAYLGAMLSTQAEMGLERIDGNVIVAAFRVVSRGYSETMWRCPHGMTYWAAPDAQMQQSLEQQLGPNPFAQPLKS